jgi:hypothetical protein
MNQHSLQPSSNRGRQIGCRVTALAACIAAAAVWAGTSTGTTLRSTACKPGPTTIRGANVHAWCGPAKAVVRVGGKTYRFANGLCLKTEGFTKGSKVVAINIGTQTLPPDAPKSSYFGVLIDKAKGGTYTDQAVSWQVPGKGFAVLVNKVVVSANLRKGSFSGRASVRINGRVKDAGLAKGSWTC